MRIFAGSPLRLRERVRVRGNRVESSGLVPQGDVSRFRGGAPVDLERLPLTPALSRKGRGRMVLDVRMRNSCFDAGAGTARPLSLPARCAFVMTNAQRARTNPQWRDEDARF